MTHPDVLAVALPAGERLERTDVLALPPDPARLREARSFVRRSVPPLAPDCLDVVLLLTSELVTNAVIHARTAVELAVATTPGTLLVMVHDEDGSAPREPDRAGRDGGWGLGLVAALADTAATQRHPEGGKTAWFRVRRVAP